MIEEAELLRKLEAAVRKGDRSQLPATEATLRDLLKVRPADPFTRGILGTLCMRLSRHEEAAEQFRKVLEIAPNDREARWNLVGTFVYRGDWESALKETDLLLEIDPDHSQYLDVRAFALLHLGEIDAAVSAYEALASKHPAAENWKSYGQALKAVGRTKDAINAYKQAITLKPDYGMPYWCLAELKTFQFNPADVDAMRHALERREISGRNRAQIHFALGRAHEDRKQYSDSFEQFRQANTTMRTLVRHNSDQRGDFVRKNKAVFTGEFFRERPDCGTIQATPIFIVGLPRSGSTLIEQVLASHSQIEATSELQILESLIRELCLGENRKGRPYPALMHALAAAEIRQAGEEYLRRTHVYRKLKRPFFIDKMPNNFTYLGMILTALPNAKIVDARRYPLANGFAMYKHYFPDAYSYAFDLADVGRYYRDYVELMAHFDMVQPGRIHRVFHERLVADPDGEIKNLLAYCGLPFEQACVRFYENDRAVLTPSAQQVRRPISTSANEQWRNYERWLGPLKSSLGDVLDRYPDVPEFPRRLPAAQWGHSGRMHWSVGVPLQSGQGQQDA